MGCVLVGIALLGLLGPLMWSAGNAMRQAHRRMQCVNNLKRIGEALHAYHDRWNCFPPAYIVGEDGRAESGTITDEAGTLKALNSPAQRRAAHAG